MAAPSNEKYILVIEDDEPIRETLRIALEFEGWNVVTAANGRLALDVLEHEPFPCMIFLDLMMPVMDGWAFMAEIQKNPVLSSIPVVIVSAFNEKVKAPQAKEMLMKPIDLSVLSRVVQKYSG